MSERARRERERERLCVCSVENLELGVRVVLKLPASQISNIVRYIYCGLTIMY